MVVSRVWVRPGIPELNGAEFDRIHRGTIDVDDCRAPSGTVVLMEVPVLEPISGVRQDDEGCSLVVPGNQG